MIKMGGPAPDFSARGFYEGKFMNFSLSDYIGKWVLLFFHPGDFTVNCAREVLSVAEKYEEFQSLDVGVFTCSVAKVNVHKMWNDHELSGRLNKNIPFPMLSDSNGRIGKSYGIYDEDRGVDNRATFIIDSQGYVRFFEVTNSPVDRDIPGYIDHFKVARDMTGITDSSYNCAGNFCIGK